MKTGDISIQGLSKRFRLGEFGFGSLREDLSGWWQRLRGRAPELPSQRINKKDLWALRDIHLEVPAGHKLGLIGANGSGKSTLLKILSRILEPTMGRIRYSGRIGSLLEVGTGFHQELTGRENIFLSGAILGMNKKEIQSSLEEIVDFSGVADFLDTPVKRYSSGMYVRLAFSVAAHLRCDILLVDEVLAVGDLEFRQKALEKMETLGSATGKTLIFVSHRMGAIREICDSVFLLQEGEGKHFADPEAGIREYSRALEKGGDLSLIRGELADQIQIENVRWNQDSLVYQPEQEILLEYQISSCAPEPIVFGLRVYRGGTLVFSKYEPEPMQPHAKDSAGSFRMRIPPKTLRPGEYQAEIYGFGSKSRKIFHSTARAGFQIEQKWSDDYREWDHGLINIK